MFIHLWLTQLWLGLCPMSLTLRIHHCLLPWQRMQKPDSLVWVERCSSRVPIRSQSSKLQLSHATCVWGYKGEREPPFKLKIPSGLPSTETPAEFPWVNCWPQAMGSSASHSRLHILIQALGSGSLRAGLRKMR